MFATKQTEIEAFYSQTVSSISMGDLEVEYVEQAEHVGTIRSVNGNSPHLISRFVAYRKALYAILPVGLARRHRVNPVVGIQAHQVYATPVLLSGITTLVLSTAEIKLLDQHFKNTVMNLRKLLDKTPSCVVHVCILKN